MKTNFADNVVISICGSFALTLKRVAVESMLVALGVFAVFGLGQIVIPLPFTPVAISLGTFAAMSIGASYGFKRSVLTLSTYVALGSVGVPLFQGFKSGVGSATFGYAFGYIVAVAIVSQFSFGERAKSTPKTLVAWLVAGAAILTFGTIWLAVMFHFTPLVAIQKGFLPFIIGDTIKAFAAAGAFPAIHKAVEKLTSK